MSVPPKVLSALGSPATTLLPTKVRSALGSTVIPDDPKGKLVFHPFVLGTNSIFGARHTARYFPPLAGPTSHTDVHTPVIRKLFARPRPATIKHTSPLLSYMAAVTFLHTVSAVLGSMYLAEPDIDSLGEAHGAIHALVHKPSLCGTSSFELQLAT